MGSLLLMDLFFFSRDFARNTFLCDGDGYLRDRRQCLIVVLERRTIPTDRKTRKEGKCGRPSEVAGKGRPAEFLFGPLPFLHRSARSPSQFHLCSPLSFPHTSARTHNSLGDIGIKYASGFQVKRRKYLPHQCRLHYSSRFSHIWYHADRYERWKRVTWPLFLSWTEDWR